MSFRIVAWNGRGKFLGCRCWLALVVIFASCFGTRSVSAEDLRQTTALKFAPADVAFFSSSLRQKEQWELLFKSRAFAKLMDSPYIKSGWEQAKGMWEAAPFPPIQEFKQTLQQPENQQLIDMLLDAISHEMFAFGDENVAPLLGILNQINALNRTARIEENANGTPRADIMSREILRILSEYADDLAVPKFVMGMKVTDKDRATAQIIRLENLLMPLSQFVPQLKGRVQRIVIGEGRFLTLHLEGKQIPWDELLSDKSPLDEDQKEELQTIADVVKPLEVMICLGLYGDYLTLAIGETTEVISSLGTGDLLADAEELAPILKYGDKRVTSIGFASAEFIAATQSELAQVRELIAMASRALQQSNPDQADLLEQLETLTDFSDASEAFAKSVVSYLTTDGIEGMTYTWGDEEVLDFTQRLTILDYLGGQPLLFAASRLKWGPDDYEDLKELAEVMYEFANEMVANFLEDEQLETYEKVRDQLLPLAARLETATKDWLLPSIADGQMALVVEAVTTGTSFHTEMPESKTPLPLPEFGLVMGIKDAAKFRRAMTEYAAIAQDVLGKLHTSIKDFPEIKIPEPRTKKVDNGEVFAWPLPDEVGLSKAITPSAGLAKNVAVLSTSPKQAVRLMQATPLLSTADNLDRPLGAVSTIHVDRMAQAAQPWANYFIQLYSDKLKADGDEAGLGNVKTIQLQTNAVLDFIACLKSISSVSYKENDIIVTRNKIRIQDAD